MNPTDTYNLRFGKFVKKHRYNIATGKDNHPNTVWIIALSNGFLYIYKIQTFDSFFGFLPYST